jgi:hypothetical protein
LRAAGGVRPKAAKWVIQILLPLITTLFPELLTFDRS